MITALVGWYTVNAGIVFAVSVVVMSRGANVRNLSLIAMVAYAVAIAILWPFMLRPRHAD